MGLLDYNTKKTNLLVRDEQSQRYLDEGRAIAQEKLAGVLYPEIYMQDIADDDYIEMGRQRIKEKTKRTLGGTIKDVAVSSAKGVVGLGEAAVGLADIPTLGRVGKGMEKYLGYDPAATQEFLGKFYSPAQKAAFEKVEKAKGFLGTTKAMLQHPSTIGHAVVESAPQMLGGAAAARKLIASGMLKMTPAWKNIIAASIGEGLVSAGATAEGIRQQTEDGVLTPKQAAISAISGAGTALFAVVGGRVAQKFGIIDPDTFLAGGSNVTSTGVIKRIIGGGITEGAFEELPQSMQEQVWLNAALDKPLLEGVGEAGATGTLTGFAMGAGFNIFTGKPYTKAEKETTATPDEINQVKADIKSGLISEGIKSGDLTSEMMAPAIERIATQDPALAKQLADMFVVKETDLSENERRFEEDPLDAENNAEFLDKYIKKSALSAEKTKVALEEVGVEIPDFKTTGEAYAFGEKATPEQVKELQRLVKVQDTKFNELKKAGKLQEAMDEAIKHQFYNEALQKVEGTEQYKKFNPEKAVKPIHELTLDEFEKAGHSPWEITQSQWVNMQRTHRKSLGQAEESGTPAAPFGDIEQFHRQEVEQARKEGLPVPENVLAEYEKAVAGEEVGKVEVKEPWKTETKLKDREYQEKYPERTVHEDWNKANSPRYDFEGAGDILREFQKKGQDPHYINEKLSRVKRFVEGHLNNTLHFDDSLDAAIKHEPKKLGRLISQYELQPVSTESQKTAKSLILNIMKGNFKEAEKNLATIEKNTDLKPQPEGAKSQTPKIEKPKPKLPRTEDLEGEGIREPTSEQSISQAYEKLSKGEWNTRVRISDIKAETGLDQNTLSKTLKEMQTDKQAVLYPFDMPSEITRADKESAVEVGGELSHIVFMKAEAIPEVKPKVEKEPYRHRPMTVEVGAARLDDLTPAFGEDIYTKNAVQYFGTGDKAIDRETVKILQSLKGKPEQEVSVYRSVEVDAKVDKLVEGDWVTINKEYAKQHGESILEGNYKIIEQKVKAQDLTTNADSFNEQGYYPVEPKVEKEKVEVTPEKKEPWQMGENEYVQSRLEDLKGKIKLTGQARNLYLIEWQDKFTVTHQRSVEKAIQEGKLPKPKKEKVEVETTPEGKEISVDLTKKEEAAVTPKQQKEYLLAEIDKAIEAEAKKIIDVNPNANLKDTINLLGKGELVGTSEQYTFTVPNDGEFEIYGSNLPEFQRRVKSTFPSTITSKKFKPKVEARKGVPTAKYNKILGKAAKDLKPADIDRIFKEVADTEARDITGAVMLNPFQNWLLSQDITKAVRNKIKPVAGKDYMDEAFKEIEAKDLEYARHMVEHTGTLMSELQAYRDGDFTLKQIAKETGIKRSGNELTRDLQDAKYAHANAVRHLEKLGKPTDVKEPSGVRDEKAFATKATKPQETITRKDLRKIFKRMKHIRTGQDSDGNLWFKAEGRPKITIYELDNITGHLNTSAGQIPVGSYLRDTIELKTGGEGHTADIGTAYHEFTHFLEKNGIISANDITALNRVIAKTKGISESNVTEEHRAYYVGDNISAWETQKHPRIRRILRKLTDFMNAIYDFAAQAGWVKGRERTAEGVIRDIESGRILKEKKEALAGVNEFAQDVSFSLKKAAKKITDNPNFVKWFKDSAVVDEKGKPLVVYHGTDKEFTIFQEGNFDVGIHLGTAEQASDRLEFKAGEDIVLPKQAILPLYVRIKNPLVLKTDPGLFDFANLPWALDQLKKFTKEEINTLKNYDGYDLRLEDEIPEGKHLLTARINLMNSFRKDVQSLLNKHGYDGIKYWNTGEIKGMAAIMRKLYAAESKTEKADIYEEKVQLEKTGGDWSYVAFEPTQIKSIFNTTFDPTNPDIRYQMAGTKAIGAPTGQLAKAQEMLAELDTKNPFDDSLALPFEEGIPTKQKVADLKKWLAENTDKYNPKYVTLYHATGVSVPVLEQGLKPTTALRRRSYQSGSGYVYLANTPQRAKSFGDLGNMGESKVYAVKVKVQDLKADVDQLNNQRATGADVKNSVAESIVYGGGARIKGKIDSWQIQDISKDKKEVWRETGWIKMKDGWKFEIDDSGAELLLSEASFLGMRGKTPDSVKGQPSTVQGFGEGMISDPNFLSNIIRSKTFLDKGYSGLDIKTQRSVKSAVVSSAKDSEIFDSVIKFIPVDVVTNLRRFQLTPKMLFQDPSMFKLALTKNLIKGIPSGVDVSGSLVRTFALARAIKDSGGIPFDSARVSEYFRITDKTIYDRHKKYITRSDDTSQVKNMPLSLLLSHPELYKAYPRIKNVLISINIKKGNPNTGSYNAAADSIEMAVSDINAIKSITLHEAQHAIQEIEGFARGGTPKTFEAIRQRDEGNLARTIGNYNKLLSKYAKEDNKEQYAAVLKVRDELTQKAIELQDYSGEKSLEDYKRLAGEIEARDTSARALLSSKHRKEIFPYESQGIPEDQWIITKGKGTSFSVQEQKAFSVKGGKDYSAMFEKYRVKRTTPLVDELTMGEEKPSFLETLEPVTSEDYLLNRKTSKSIKLTAKTNIKRVASEIAEGVDKFLGSTSTRIGRVSLKLKAKLRKLDFDINTKYAADVKSIHSLLKKAKKMDRNDFADWDYARKNSDINKINELVNKYNMQAEYAAYRKVLDDTRKEGLDVGLVIGEIEEYAPRILKDDRGFLKEIGKPEYRPLYSDQLKKRAQDMKMSVESLPLDLKADIISNIMLGGWVGLGGIPATKHRVLQKIPVNLNKYYMHSDAALMQHLYSMRKGIEARKFFGEIPKKVKEIRKRLYRVQSQIRELGKSLKSKLSETELAKIKKQRNKYIGLEKQYMAYIQKYALQRDYTENIGAYIVELIEKKEIDAKHERIVNDMLKARFHEVGTRGVIQMYKNLSYIDTMGSPISALTQIGDMAWAMYEGGLIRSLKYGFKAAIKKSRITKEDVGVERIAQEFADSGTLGDAVSKVFKIVGLEKIDSIGKEALLNTALEKYQKRAKKEPLKFKKELKPIFGIETNSVIEDLVNDEISENVKLLVYSRLLDFQPVALSEMPQRYLDAGNGRLFYMLKTFTLKVFDVFRNESYNKIRYGNKADKIQGMKNFVRLSLFFVLANAGADELKDWVLGRKTDFKDRVVDNILRLCGVSKFVTWKARTEGVGSALARQVLPPFKFIDSAGKDIITAGDEKGLEVIGSIPVVGKLAYWHLGRGTSKREDLWNRRLRKQKAKLNKIKDGLEKTKNKTGYRREHRVELRKLRQVNELQGQLNDYRKRINRLKSMKEIPARKKRIQMLEVRRTELIKKFLSKN